MNILRKLMASLLAFALVATASPVIRASPVPAEPTQSANLSESELDAIVSPIALYPDQLIAQILGAATYPDQITAANDWLANNQSLSGDALMQAVDTQTWDPSVKALTQFPTVIDKMAKNLAWTSALGDAAFNQQKEVMAAIQKLRRQAKSAGNLSDSKEIKIVQQDPQTIVIQPTDPQVVYVPVYNPTIVYGTPYNPPGYNAGAVVAASVISFGVGIAIGAAISNNHCCGWGWGNGGWGCSWHGGHTMYRNNIYVSRSVNFYGANRNHYRNTYYGGNRPSRYNSGNRNNYNGGNNRVGNNNINHRGGNRNTNVSGNTVNINTGGNKRPGSANSNSSRPSVQRPAASERSRAPGGSRPGGAATSNTARARQGSGGAGTSRKAASPRGNSRKR